MPACEACSAPTADWLDEISALASERAVSIALHDAGLNAQRVLERRERILPALPGAVDQRGGARRHVRRAILRRESLIDLLDVIGDALGLMQKLLGLRDRLLDGLQRRIGKIGEIAAPD